LLAKLTRGNEILGIPVAYETGVVSKVVREDSEGTGLEKSPKLIPCAFRFTETIPNDAQSNHVLNVFFFIMFIS
jgi:hypothetical protein